MNISVENNELVVRIPLFQKEVNPYMEEEDLRETDNLVGIIADDEYTISQLIDLNYKGTQQEGMPILYFNSREELEKVCKLANIQIWEHEICAYCKKVIRGVHTFGEKGIRCSSCET